MSRTKAKITDSEGKVLLDGTTDDLARAARGSNSNVKQYAERWLNIQQEKDDAAQAHKDLRAEMKASGFDKESMAAFMLVIKELRKPIDPNVKALANAYFAQADGQYTLFGE
jgi:uncharacterized protein (UPF0335 family)